LDQNPGHLPLDANIESVGRDIIDCGLRVHQTLGPGLLESAYEACLAYEVGRRGLSVRRQVALPIIYDGVTLDAGYKIDILVEGAVIVEIKAIDSLQPIHQAQLLTYLKLSGLRLGYLMNFNVALFRQGIKRIVL
jgi:GxxExxY protein